ncbi:4-diphosphocytidyl-2C-methyl-D-erythritol synthase [Sphingobium sp. SCG-1]|uniref:nucleotidyltransferase family protein n=1 Tax=Sphingobium sp. SCG-1 TaxID=2072936 RepID=UPI000CD67FA7|nr:nucleotidyltransferase family protein [Sphingobium sp. SCG-1]AUW57682.1 4-diphosphocytidyl-2C-methyl-D-erythritol synthase [Sphingobium sp. SCG-1]
MHSATPLPGVTAIVLAGSRPGVDPLLDGSGVSTKALLPVAGRPMLAHVLGALVGHGAVGRVVVLAQDIEALSNDPALAAFVADPAVSFARSGAGISRSVIAEIDGGAAFPILLTTADNVLLTGAMIDAFVFGARGSDIAVGLVERQVLLARYPESRRTWLKFRRGWWSGANLFWIGSEKARPLLERWHAVEQDRKKGMKIVGAFGPLLLIGALLRLLTIQQAVARLGRRLGVNARVVAMPQAEACIDVDKPSDLTMAEAILAARA